MQALTKVTVTNLTATRISQPVTPQKRSQMERCQLQGEQLESPPHKKANKEEMEEALPGAILQDKDKGTEKKKDQKQQDLRLMMGKQVSTNSQSWSDLVEDDNNM